MNMMTRMLVIACLALPFAACKKEEAPKAVEAAPLTAPTTDDVAAWRAYVTDVAKRNMDGITNSPYVYFLPSEASEGFGGDYQRLLEKVEGDLGRGIIPACRAVALRARPLPPRARSRTRRRRGARARAPATTK